MRNPWFSRKPDCTIQNDRDSTYFKSTWRNIPLKIRQTNISKTRTPDGSYVIKPRYTSEFKREANPLKCNGIGCRSNYPEPDIIDGTAYFVCSDCGDYHEVENYQIYSTEQKIKIFEDEYRVRLPPEYIQHAGTNDSWVVRLPLCDTDSTQYYFGEGFYTIGKLSGIEPDPYGCSIFDSASLAKEWGLPEKLVLIEGDGHTWLALDYRESDTAPKVIVIESDESNSLVVASNYREFVQSLLPYESVYDPNGNIIFKT